MPDKRWSLHEMAQGNLDREASPAPLQLAFPLPKAPDTTVHAHLTINPTSILLFLSTTQQGDASSLASLGSFVYALPDVRYCFRVAA